MAETLLAQPTPTETETTDINEAAEEAGTILVERNEVDGSNNTTVEDEEKLIEGEEQETLYADKFKSVSDLENSYKELQSTFSKKMGQFQGSPEEYSLDPEMELQPDETFFAQGLAEWGKENQLSEDGYTQMVEQFRNSKEALRDIQIEATRKELGTNAAQRLDNISTFLGSKLEENEFNEIAAGLTTPGQILAMEKLIDLSKAPAPVQVQAVEADPNKIREMRFALDEYGERKMNNPQYRAKVLKMEASLKG